MILLKSATDEHEINTDERDGGPILTDKSQQGRMDGGEKM